MTHDPKAGPPLPDSVCRICGKVTNDATASDGSDAKPKPGDLAICIWCRSLSVYDHALKLRELTDDEWLEVAGDEGVKRSTEVVAMVGDAVRKKGKR